MPHTKKRSAAVSAIGCLAALTLLAGCGGEAISAQCILIPLSYMLVLTEASFYTMLVNIGYVWMAFLLFTGTLVTHQYTFAKSVLMIVFILLGMCMMAYIALLFFNLIQQMSGFFVTLWAELKLRLS